MTSSRGICALAGSFALAAFSGPVAAEPASYAVQITGHVPVICNVSTTASVVAISDGVADLGNISEFCNNSSGYQVWIDYTPGVRGSTIDVDGTRMELSTSGSTMISSSSTAGAQKRHVTVYVGDNPDVLSSLSMRIVPL